MNICIFTMTTLATIFAAANSFAGEEPSQTAQSIRAAAEQHVAHTARGDNTMRVTAVANPIDSRLRLPQCEQELRTDTPYGNAKSSRITVEVACDAPKAWRLYVPVRLELFMPVVVAARPLPRDTVVTAQDLMIEEREIARLNGYIKNPEHAIGQKLRRALQLGAAVTPTALSRPPAVRRGQVVTVKAASSALSVAMTGTALQDGGIGDVIDITNNSSNRRIQAIVRSARVVEVLLH